DENPIRTLGDYSRPSHKDCGNTMELPNENNVVPLRSDTIRKGLGYYEELSRYEDEGWNDPNFPEEGSLNYKNSNIEQLLGIMEHQVDTLMKDTISLMGKSEDLCGLSSNTMHQLPPEPLHHEAFKSLIMNFILNQDEKVCQLKEYMCVIGSDFMQLSLEVVE
nr:hypothetical protein [Tanacetum cinerariifolium]